MQSAADINMNDLIFCGFSLLTALAALGAVSARASVYAILSMMVMFVGMGAALILIGVEFVGLSLIIVYVGAVAVLFLFIVMMVDLPQNGILEQGTQSTALTMVRNALITTIAIASICTLMDVSIHADGAKSGGNVVDDPIIFNQAELPDAIQLLGDVLYDRYGLAFQLVGLILLVAMIGAVVMVMEEGRSEDTGGQPVRRPRRLLPSAADGSVSLHNPLRGGGVDIPTARHTQ